ncbi:MAG: hypothetical protein H0X38_02775 [Planctomycetes bacterium]|nr:hypothetical protein [Planctomycetota bacterium]
MDTSPDVIKAMTLSIDFRALEAVSEPSPTAPGSRRLRLRQTIHFVLNMAYDHASAQNGSSSLPRSTIARLATGMVLKPPLSKCREHLLVVLVDMDHMVIAIRRTADERESQEEREEECTHGDVRVSGRAWWAEARREQHLHARSAHCLA